MRPRSKPARSIEHNKFLASLEKLQIADGGTISEKTWTVSDAENLRHCLESKEFAEETLRAMVDARLKAIGRFQCREVTQSRVAKGNVTSARVPVAIAYVLEFDRCYGLDISKLKFSEEVTPESFMVEERRTLLQEVIKQLLAV